MDKPTGKYAQLAAVMSDGWSNTDEVSELKEYGEALDVVYQHCRLGTFDTEASIGAISLPDSSTTLGHAKACLRRIAIDDLRCRLLVWEKRSSRLAKQED